VTVSTVTVTVTVLTVTVTVTVHNRDGGSRNDLERSGTIWNEVKISVTVTSRFPLKTKDSL